MKKKRKEKKNRGSKLFPPAVVPQRSVREIPEGDGQPAEEEPHKVKGAVHGGTGYVIIYLANDNTIPTNSSAAGPQPRLTAVFGWTLRKKQHSDLPHTPSAAP